jgi:hypothetical protein
MPTVGRILRLAGSLNSTVEAYLFIRLVFWCAYFRIMKRYVPLPGLVGRAVPRAKTQRLRISPARIAVLGELAARAIRAGGEANCLERSLTIYRQLIRTGGKPALAVTFQRNINVLGHVSVIFEGKPLGEREPISLAEPFARFDATGKIQTDEPLTREWRGRNNALTSTIISATDPEASRDYSSFDPIRRQKNL